MLALEVFLEVAAAVEGLRAAFTGQVHLSQAEKCTGLAGNRGESAQLASRPLCLRERFPRRRLLDSAERGHRVDGLRPTCAFFVWVVHRECEERSEGAAARVTEPVLRSPLGLRVLVLGRHAAELADNVRHGLLCSILRLDLRQYRFLHRLPFALNLPAGFPVLLIRLRPSCAGDDSELCPDTPFKTLFASLEQLHLRMPTDLSQLLVVQLSWTALIDRPRHSISRSDYLRLRRQTAVDRLRILRNITREVIILEDVRVRVLQDEVPLYVANRA